MKHLLLTLCLSAALHAQQPAAAPHTFTSTDGRKLTASIIETTAATVTLRRAEDGKDFILPLDRLSAADQTFVKAWGAELPPTAAAKPDKGSKKKKGTTKQLPQTADPALPESWVVEPKYDTAWHFSRLPGTVGPMFSTFKKGNVTGLIRSDGLVLCDPDKGESCPESLGASYTANYFKYQRTLPKLIGGKWGIVDVDGRQVMPPQWDEVGKFREGLFDFTLAGKKGYANPKGEVVLQPQWAEARPFYGGYASVRVGTKDKWSVIDKTGKVVADAAWDAVSELSIGRVTFGGDFADSLTYGSWFDYRPAEFPPGLFCVRLDKKWRLYDFGKNAPVGEGQWDPAEFNYGNPSFIQGKAWVQRNGKYGMIDLTGKMVLEPTWEGEMLGKFQRPPEREGDCIKAVKDGKNAWRRLDGTALPEDVRPHDFYYYGRQQLKIESGKLTRLEMDFNAKVLDRMYIHRGMVEERPGITVFKGDSSAFAALADLSGNPLGQPWWSSVHRTPSPDYFLVTKSSKKTAAYGLIDASGKEVEPASWIEVLPLDDLQITNPAALPDGEIVAAFRGDADTATPDALFVKTPGGLVKVPWKAPDTTIEEAPGTVTVKAHQKGGKWGYIKLTQATPLPVDAAVRPSNPLDVPQVKQPMPAQPDPKTDFAAWLRTVQFKHGRGDGIIWSFEDGVVLHYSPRDTGTLVQRFQIVSMDAEARTVKWKRPGTESSIRIDAEFKNFEWKGGDDSFVPQPLAIEKRDPAIFGKPILKSR